MGVSLMMPCTRSASYSAVVDCESLVQVVQVYIGLTSFSETHAFTAFVWGVGS